ncbi:hypothetical protein BPUTSESOX_868 [uncultured Gammaproteobacteria bacterium]|nr:hypothetical protein BPUTSESOX_868 [uncultured Gammaproteobacteria bacterium]
MVNIPFDRLIECCTYDVNSRVLDYEWLYFWFFLVRAHKEP